MSDWSITLFETASSSSDLVKQASGAGASEGAGVLVHEQTAGRGRRGARWMSAKGGMYFSLLLRPQFGKSSWFGLSFVAALAIREELAQLVSDDLLTLKWPNDVLAGTKASRGKICGILLEASGDDLIIGTGVNIAPVKTPPSARQQAVSLTDFNAGDTLPMDLARAYQRNLERRYREYARSGFLPVREEWMAHAAHLGERMVVHSDTGMIDGVFDGIGPDGNLHLLDGNGSHHHISTGDVELLGTL